MTRAVSVPVILVAAAAGLVVATLGYGWGMSLLAAGVAGAGCGGCVGGLTALVMRG